jgi:hypothetical protein
MIFTLIVSLVTIFFDLVLHGDFNDLFVRLILGLCLTLYVVAYSLWRVFLSNMAAYLSQEATQTNLQMVNVDSLNLMRELFRYRGGTLHNPRINLLLEKRIAMKESQQQ